MVMFSGWQRTAPDTGIPSDLPMNGESTDLGVSPPDPAGYLGKVNERASLVENCPWCSAKGQIYGLRSYRINFHESITLCTNPECLFPLVSKPLEEILSSLTAADCKDGGKRKGPGDEDPVACSKRHKAEDPEDGVGLATDAGLGDSGDTSAQNASPNGDGERAEAPAHPPREGSGRQADPGSRDLACGDLGHGAPPLQNGSLGADGGGPDAGRGEPQPSGPLRVAEETGSENGDGTVPMSDRVSSVVEAARPTAEQIGLLLKEQVLTGGSKEPEASPTVEQEVRPTVEPEVRPMAELEASLSEDQAERLTEDEEECPVDLQEVRLTELKMGPTAEVKARPMVEPEAVPEEQTARLAEEEEELPMEVQEVRLTEELNVGPTAEAEARPMVEPEAIPVEQAARLAAELKVGPTVEEVRSTVEEEVRPTVEQEDGPAKMVAVPSHLFWRNESNLCWLDTLLVALVHCRTLRKHVASLLKNNSPVQQLCNRYREACDHVKAQEQMGHEDKIAKVPSAVLNQTVKELEDVRMSTFKLLQPKLKLSLGQEETPVFALPVLLRLDSSVETLFQHIFHWDFECAVCGHTSRSRCQKTLSTFTGVFPDWHPLRAVHQAQCNNCERKLQKRKMVLKSISPVFALHFVEGLPQNDVDAYSFDFHGNHYSVSTVIQYDQHLKHFVAWIRDDSGSWLEFDDLKYPQCTSHKRLPVPASQIHMVFWEVGAAKPEGACPAGGHQGDAAPEAGAGDLSLTFPQDDTYIVEALTQGGTSPDRPDSSVGSSTLLEAFEGLSHSDIVTLTLVEVKADGGAPPDGQPPPVAAATSPVSSTRAAGGKGCQTTKRQRGARGARRAPGGGTPVPQDRGPAGPPSTATPLRWPFPTPDPSSPVSDPPSPVSKPPSPSAFPASRMSAVLSKHPLFQSTPAPPKRAAAALSYKPALKLATDDGLPDRVAAAFSGFQARGVAAPTDGPLCRTDGSRPENEAFKQPAQKPPGPRPGAGNPEPASLKPARGTEVPPQTTLLRPAKDPKTKISPLDDTGALRRKLMRKLKKKKQLLAALDSMMGKEALDSLQRPDSTEVGSPYTVSSTTSQCSSAGYDEFLSDLLSPATTASNLSPDSTGLLEMLVTAPEGVENPPTAVAAARPGGGGTADWAVPAATGNDLASAKDDFLDELMSGTGFQTSQAENVDFNMLDMFF